ncbi:MAG TPA: polysaccharide deacetylase family protein [Bryobacteraceae bacterium]|nr:polysaccharide deacetylase family protein [Bryobacteraceae bacterium]
MPSAESRRVTLTFDNGPEPRVTPLVLDSLARHKIKTTFFVMGRKAVTADGQSVLRRASAEGHWIGNHTFSHISPLGRLDEAAALREFEQTERALEWLVQPRKLFRPPGGAGKIGKHLLQPAIVAKLQQGGYTCVLWNSVPGDFRDPDGWLDRAVADCQSHHWTLLVLHDLPNGAMKHLEEFLVRLEAAGVEFTQDYPPECVPILDGKIVAPLDSYVTS